MNPDLKKILDQLMIIMQMSKFFKEFETQKQKISPRHIQQISQGINRIRFIKNRVNDKANFVLKLLSTQRELYTIKSEDSKKFITSYSASNSSRRPLSELRSVDEFKSVGYREKKLQQAQKIKEQRKQLQAVIRQRNTENKLQNMLKKRKVLQNKQTAKIKIRQYKQHQAQQIRQFKQRLIQQNTNTNTNIKNKHSKQQQIYIQSLEQKIMLGQKMRDYILDKMQRMQQEGVNTDTNVNTNTNTNTNTNSNTDI